MEREDRGEREKIYACWLCNFPGIGDVRRRRLAELCGGAEAAYAADRSVWEQALSAKQARKLAEYTAKWQPEKEYRRMKEAGIGLVTFYDREYPQRLREIPDAPFGLFVRGKLPGEGGLTVAVIGARENSEYGRYVAAELGSRLGRQGVTVVSGMARGIDGISQAAALEAGGSSIGVLGCGVDICYPSQNRELYNRLLKNGAVVSPYPIGTPARPQNFPPRNRIVSGLADAVVVVEARVKSGTLITVDMALEQGREVYVVPGRVTDRLSDGCNRLIKQGAGVFLSPESFLEELGRLVEQKTRAAFWKCGGYGIEDREGEECGAAKAEKTEEPELASKQREKLQASRRGREGREERKEKEQEEIRERSKNLPLELAEIYEALDFYPKTPEEIGDSLSGEWEERRIVTGLMQLAMEALAVQVSPGHFCRKG